MTVGSVAARSEGMIPNHRQPANVLVMTQLAIITGGRMVSRFAYGDSVIVAIDA